MIGAGLEQEKMVQFEAALCIHPGVVLGLTGVRISTASYLICHERCFLTGFLPGLH
jgi:hypothetical protein